MRKVIIWLVPAVVLGAALIIGLVSGNHSSPARSLKAQAADQLLLMSADLSRLRAQSPLISADLDSLRSRSSAAETYLTALVKSDARNQQYLVRCQSEIIGPLAELQKTAHELTGPERRSLEDVQQRVDRLIRDLRR